MIVLFSKDNKTLRVIKDSLQNKFEIKIFIKAEEMLAWIGVSPPEVIILDCDMKNQDCLAVYQQIKKINPHLAVIMVSSFVDIPFVVRASKLGAADFLRKPISRDRLISSVFSAVKKEETPDFLAGISKISWLEGRSVLRTALIQDIKSACAPFSDAVLLGEAGIDKQAVGEMIHKNTVSRGTFRIFNLASFSREEEEAYFWTLLKEMLCISEEAKIKTLYLKGFDKLGRHFQDSIVRFLGQRRSNPQFDKGIKVLLETSSAVPGLADFCTVDIPALRFRKEDLAMMVISYIKEYSAKLNKAVRGIGVDLIPFLVHYDFPGNFRELEELLKGAILRCSREFVVLADFPQNTSMIKQAEKNKLLSQNSFNLVSVRKDFEQVFFRFALEGCSNDRKLAARFLDVPLSVFEDRLNLAA